MALSASFVLLVTPTVVFNGALWGQCDMVFAAPLVVALAAAFNKRYYLTTALFGLAIAIKLQAIFLFPMLGVWFLRKELPWRSLLLIPVVFFICLVPAWVAGCSLIDLLISLLPPPLTVHGLWHKTPSPTSESGSWSKTTRLNSPSIFNLLADDERWLGAFGLWFAIAAVFMGMVACLYSKKRPTVSLTTQQAVMFSCLTPFLLPHMHERYIFLGDVISVLYAFLRPRHFWLTLLVVGASFVSYFPFLFEKVPVPLSAASVMLGGASIFLFFDLLRTMYPGAFAEPSDTRQT